MSKRPQSAAPTSPSKRTNRKTAASLVEDTLSFEEWTTLNRPKSAVARASGQAYLAGAGIWGKNQATRNKIRSTTAVHRVRKVIKVRNTKHLRTAKAAFHSNDPAHLHTGRDSYIYPSSRPNSSHSHLNRFDDDYNDNDDDLDDEYYNNTSAILDSNNTYVNTPNLRPSSAYNYGGFRRSGVERGRPNSSTISARPSTASTDLRNDDMGERKYRYPPWSQPVNQDAFARQSSRQYSAASSRPGSSRPGSSRPGSSRPGSRGSTNPSYKKRQRPLSSMSSMSATSLITEEYATTSWSRPSSRGDMHSRPGTSGSGGGDYYYEDTFIEEEEEEDDDPFKTWQQREHLAMDKGYSSTGMARRQRPSSAASTSPDSRNRNSTGEVRPHSPEPLVPHPKGGKLRAKSAHGTLNAHTGAHHSNYTTGVENLILNKNEDQPDPWDVHLNATIPRPRNAITVVAPPTAPLRRPTTALLRGTPQPNTRPWSTDPTLLAKAKSQKAPALIHLNDGRPHTIGESRHAEPSSKLVTYFDAFQLTGSHVEARRMMDTQHRMLGESAIRAYEYWELDKTDLVKQKQATKRWGTSGEFPMENPVTRSLSVQKEVNEQKQLHLLTKASLKSGNLKYIRQVAKKRERIETAKRTRDAANPHRRPNAIDTIDTRDTRETRDGTSKIPATIEINKWGDQKDIDSTTTTATLKNRGGTRGGPLTLPGSAAVAIGKGVRPMGSTSKRTPNEEAFHASMMNSYGTGEIEVLWQNLTAIPRSIMMCSLALQCQHLTALRISGNKITVIPKWLFPSLHALVELNVSNNKLTLLPENIEVLKQLQKLTISYNRIVELPTQVSNCSNLRMFDCTGNLIRTLPPTISNLKLLKLFRIGDNDLRFLSGGVENLLSLEELILTRNRIGTMALIQPLIIRQARKDDIWEKSRIKYSHDSNEIIYMNQTTGETLRRPPQGATIMEASSFVESSSEEDEDEEEMKEKEKKKKSMTKKELKEEIRWKNKLQKRAERLELRNELAQEGKGIWEVKWTQFTGSAYYYNHFDRTQMDTMPKELDRLGFLPMIRRLVISFNVLQELPPSIGRLDKLVELIIDHNKLKKLPDEIGTMLRLKYLSFADNRLETLPKTIGHMKRLHRINATYNHIKTLPVEVGKLTGLVQLWLSNNKINVLPVEMWTMTSLTELHLADNPLTKPRLDVVEKGIPFLLRELKEQWLRLNVLGTPPTVSVCGVGVRGEIIMPEPKYKKILENILRHAKKTSTLEMQWKELHHVPIGAYDLVHLTELRLQNNFLKASAILDTFKTFKQLIILSLSNNQLHEFPIVLLRVNSIEHLDLSNNYISELPKRIDRMYRLKTINFSQNRLTALPEKIGKCIDLYDVNLDINRIGPTLPKSICQLYKLQTLKLVKNRLKTLPLNGLMNLTALTLLNLNSNIIGPSLPDDISFIPHLIDLKLSHNRIKVLPSNFCLHDLCHSLEKLWLYGNRIVQLPHEFRFLTTLTDLRLENNPMISPPTILSLQGPGRIRTYCKIRLDRITTFKSVLRQEHIRFNNDALIPKSIKVFTEGTDYLTANDLEEFDMMVDRTLNGAYYNHEMNINDLVAVMKDKKMKRRIAHHKLLLEKFLLFIDIAIEKSVLNPKYFREDLVRPIGEESKDEECYALLLEPLYEKQIGVNLPSVQRRIDEDIAERHRKAESLGIPFEEHVDPNAIPPSHSILDVTNDIFRTKRRPEFHYPLWQLREAATEWVGPFGNVAGFEHGLTFQDTQGYDQARLDLEVVTEKIKRQKKGWKQAKQRIKEAHKKHDAKVAAAQKDAEERKAAGEEKKQDDQDDQDGSGGKVAIGEKGDLGILSEYDKLIVICKVLKETMANSQQHSHDDVCVILKVVYTLDEIRREKEEDYDGRVGEIEVRKEVEGWLETKHGKKAMEERLKEVSKFFKLQLKLVRDEIKALLNNKPKLTKDFKAMKKRKKAFDKGKKIDFHNFNTLDESIEAMRLVQAPLDEMDEKEVELREIEVSRLALTVKVKKEKPLVLEEQKIALIDRYGKKEKKRIIEEGRKKAREENLRRPWDGPAGRAFRLWKEKADNLLEALLNPPSDTPSSESTDMSTDSEPELDETSAASVERHKKWKKMHDEKVIANKYKWGRLLTDDQIVKQAQKAEERRLAIFKYSKPTAQEDQEADENDAQNKAEDGDDESDGDGSDEDEDSNEEESNAAGERQKEEEKKEEEKKEEGQTEEGQKEEGQAEKEQNKKEEQEQKKEEEKEQEKENTNKEKESKTKQEDSGDEMQ